MAKGWRIRRFFRNYKVKKIDNGVRLKKEIEELQSAQKEKQLQAQRDKLVEKAVLDEAKKQKDLELKEAVQKVKDLKVKEVEQKIEEIAIKLEINEEDVLGVEEKKALSSKLAKEWIAFFDAGVLSIDITEEQKVRKEKLLGFLKKMSEIFGPRIFMFKESPEKMGSICYYST